MSLCVLGSGSGGNSSVLRVGDQHLLIDAGFGPRTTARRLAQAGLTLTDLSAICVTHFDNDHFRKSWVKTMVSLGLPLFCHHWHLPDLRRVPSNQQLFEAGLVQPFDEKPFELVSGLLVKTLRVQHDRQGTIAYRFEADGPGLSVGLATDLGHAPPKLLLHMAGVDLLAIESNYDERMTKLSSRPAFVNRRNLSDSGHLSNDQAFAAVQRIAELSPHGNPRRVVLLHRSSQCNHPTKVARCFAQDQALAKRVVQTDQRRRSRWLHVPPLKPVRRLQMTLSANLLLG
jgi:ribonuclease BN (tRNA processing enzyme)